MKLKCVMNDKFWYFSRFWTHTLFLYERSKRNQPKAVVQIAKLNSCIAVNAQTLLPKLNTANE